MREPLHSKAFPENSKQEPFQEAIGAVAWQWSVLHARLGDLFVKVARPKSEDVGRAIWSSHRSDRAARDMLRDAIKASPDLDERLRSDLLWLMKATNEASVYRNDAMHVVWRAGPDFIEATTSEKVSQTAEEYIRPDPHWTKKLSRIDGKDTLLLFRELSGHLQRLANFALSLNVCLIFQKLGIDPGEMWPDRFEPPNSLRPN